MSSLSYSYGLGQQGWTMGRMPMAGSVSLSIDSGDPVVSFSGDFVDVAVTGSLYHDGTYRISRAALAAGPVVLKPGVLIPANPQPGDLVTVRPALVASTGTLVRSWQWLLDGTEQPGETFNQFVAGSGAVSVSVRYTDDNGSITDVVSAGVGGFTFFEDFSSFGNGTDTTNPAFQSRYSVQQIDGNTGALVVLGGALSTPVGTNTWERLELASAPEGALRVTAQIGDVIGTAHYEISVGTIRATFLGGGRRRVFRSGALQAETNAVALVRGDRVRIERNASGDISVSHAAAAAPEAFQSIPELGLTGAALSGLPGFGLRAFGQAASFQTVRMESI